MLQVCVPQMMEGLLHRPLRLSVGYETWPPIVTNCIINQSHKSHNAPVSYLTIHHSEQKCGHFCSEWCIVGYRTGALWDFLNFY